MVSLSIDISATSIEADAAELLPLVTDVGNRLAVQRRVPVDLQSVLDKVADRLPESPVGLELSGIDPYLAESLTYGVMRCYRALTKPIAEARPELRIGLEQVRQALAYIVEEAPTSDARPANEVAGWLVQTLDSSQNDIAEILGVSGRTLYRWSKGTSLPAGPESARLRIVARLVNNLRHAMTAAGVLLWLGRPHPDLQGRPPRDLFDTPDAYPTLLNLAARMRSHTAS